jgi:hypothetical protein
MRQAQMRPIPHLPELTLGMLMLGVVLGAILLWSMPR